MSTGGGESSSNSSQQVAGSSANNSINSGQYANGAVNAGQLQGALNSAQSLYQNGNPYVTGGIQSIQGGANAATGLNTAGNALVGNTLNGSYLSSGNPYFGNMVSQVGDAIRPQIDGQFAAAGRYGSGAAANAYGSALANQAGQMAYQNYGAERGNQVATANNLPGYTQGLFQPGQALMTAGYTPLNQYITALSTLKPGTIGSGSTTANATGTTNSTGIAQGGQSQFGVNTAAKK